MEIREKILERKAKVAVIGLGYVGLPLAVAIARAGFSVWGIDKDRKRIASLRKGKSYLEDLTDSIVLRLVKKRKLLPEIGFTSLKKADLILICVPTPLRKSKIPDISYIIAATKKIAQSLEKGKIIILESTTYPGTTREIVGKLLEKKGLKAGEDFYLAFSPERIDPGNKVYHLKNTPKIVGGINEISGKLAGLFYQQFIDKVIVVSSSEVAEMVKLLENTFRAVNIGLVNEFALICQRLKLDTWEIVNAAASKPYGFLPFYPGPGIGGHCLPVDPHYLSWRLKKLNFPARFIDLAEKINFQMPEFVTRRVKDILRKRGKNIRQAKILLLGITYKKDISDIRESPAIDVFLLLEKAGAKVLYHDPLVKSFLLKGKRHYSQNLTEKLLKKIDCLVITTDHSSYDYPWIVKHTSLIFDARGVTYPLKKEGLIRL